MGLEKIFSEGGGGGGGPNSQKGSDGKFQHGKNNLAMPGRGGGGGGPDPLSPPLDPPMHPSHYPTHRELEPTYTGHSGETKD